MAAIDMTLPPYSADPTGKTDVGPAILQALNDTKGARPLYFPGGTYRRDTAISSGYPLTIIGDGPGITVFLSSPLTIFAQAIGVGGGTFTAAADIPAGAQSIQLTDVTAIVAGDYLNVRSLAMWPTSGPDGSDKGGRYGELVRVYRTDPTTNTVYLTGPTSWGYALADTVTVDRLRMLRNALNLSGFTVRNPAPNTGSGGGFSLKRATGIRIRDVEFEQMDGPGITGLLTADLKASGVTFRDGSEQFTRGRYTYGFDMRDACRDWQISDCHMDGGRHLFTTNSYGKGTTLCYGIPQHAVISGCTATGSYEAPFDTHEESSDIAFVGCRVHNSRGFAFQVRGARTSLLDCTASNMGVGAIIRRTSSDALVRGFIARDIHKSGAGYPHAVQVEAGCGGPVVEDVVGSGVDGDLIHYYPA